VTEQINLIRIKLDHLSRMREYLQYSLSQVEPLLLLKDWAGLSPDQHESLAAFRSQLAGMERATDPSAGPDYIGRYREFKYQENLFELCARQFEPARVDESREGALIKVVDVATAPERNSDPRHAIPAAGTALAVALPLVVGLLLRASNMRRASIKTLDP